MKRLLAFALAVLCVLPLSACSRGRDMNWVISNEPSVRGIVEEIGEDYVLIRVTKADDPKLVGLVRAEKATRLNDCKFSEEVGDEVAVYYDSDTAVTYGAVPEIHDIHGYCLLTPANRGTE